VGDELQEAVAPVVGALGLELVELELRSGLLRVVVDSEGGVDLDTIALATRQVSGLLDQLDLIPGNRYTLEVSSPGLERPLKTPSQFSRAVGEEVLVRTLPSAGLDRRIRGRLYEAGPEGVVVSGEGLPEEGVRIAYADIERARTVFDWGPAERQKPGGKQRSQSTKAARKSAPSAKGQVPGESVADEHPNKAVAS
jgi:ribosome maturation factor RimP